MSMTPELPEEPVKSRCCGSVRVAALVFLHEADEDNGGKILPHAIGRVPLCGQCRKPAGAFVAMKRDGTYSSTRAKKCPDDFTADTWKRMTKAGSEYRRLNCKRNELGVIMPIGAEVDKRYDFKAVVAEQKKEYEEDVPF